MVMAEESQKRAKFAAAVMRSKLFLHVSSPAHKRLPQEQEITSLLNISFMVGVFVYACLWVFSSNRFSIVVSPFLDPTDTQ